MCALTVFGVPLAPQGWCVWLQLILGLTGWISFLLVHPATPILHGLFHLV